MAITYAAKVLSVKAGHYGLCNQLQGIEKMLTTSKSSVKPEISLARPKELHKDEELFLAIHRHEYGETTVLFACKSNLTELSNLLSEDQAVQLAERLGLDYEPEKGESLAIVDFDPEVMVISVHDMVADNKPPMGVQNDD